MSAVSMIKWLPGLLLFKDSGNDWEKYFEKVYAQFKADFIDKRLSYRGQKVGLKQNPLSKGKEATFWHLISEGKIEEERTPDLRRCERIGWPAPIIENCDDSCLKVWVETIKNEDRIHLLCPQERYLLVLAVRRGYILPWTAFYIKYDHQLEKKLKKYEQYKKLTTSPLGTAS